MAAPETLIFHSVPVYVLLAWAIYELTARLISGRAREPWTSWIRVTGWAIRPWGVWAIFNAVFRWRWADGFNNRRTFPFFANLWEEEEPLRETALRLMSNPVTLGWIAVVVADLLGVAVVIRRVVRDEDPSRGDTITTLIVLYLLSASLAFSIGSLPNGMGTRDHENGSLLSGWKPHASMLFTVPVVIDTEFFLENYIWRQPELRHTIHGLSHPPGAPLSIYWIGCAMGVRDMDILSNAVKYHYSIGLILFGSLNVFILYGLGAALFDSRRTGLATAILWLCAPLVLIYGIFAQDALYAVFFNLALLLTWLTTTAQGHRYGLLVALGATFFCMTMLNYSWCIVTAIFFLFACTQGLRQGWHWRDWLIRIVLPLGVMTLMLAVLLVDVGLDYLEMYRTSREYVGHWYNFETLYQTATALVGGQIDLFVLMGTVACSAFIVSLTRIRTGRALRHPRTVFLLTILAVYALPILAGPSSLKMEVARCWNWVSSVPMALAASVLLSQSRRGIFLGGAAILSAVTYAVMRLFLDFSP